MASMLRALCFLWFDQTRCADGIQSLRYYRYDVDGQFSKQPAHDAASHEQTLYVTLPWRCRDITRRATRCPRPGRRVCMRRVARPRMDGEGTGFLMDTNSKAFAIRVTCD